MQVQSSPPSNTAEKFEFLFIFFNSVCVKSELALLPKFWWSGLTRLPPLLLGKTKLLSRSPTLGPLFKNRWEGGIQLPAERQDPSEEEELRRGLQAMGLLVPCNGYQYLLILVAMNWIASARNARNTL